MGQLVNFCAGADIRKRPGQPVDGLMLNTPAHGSNHGKREYARNLIESLKPEYVMLDSGGYQLLVAQEKGHKIIEDPSIPAFWKHDTINLAPEHVIYAARSLNPNILIGPDFPIRKLSDPLEQKREFRQKLSGNVRWARRISTLRKRYVPGVELFMPVQCYTLEQFDRYMDRISMTSFDGLSMPTRNLSFQGIAEFLVRMHEMGIRRVHLLGVGSFHAFAMAAYLARHYFDWISLDSTTWRIAAQHMGFLTVDSLTYIELTSKYRNTKRLSNLCRCPWCKGRKLSHLQRLIPGTRGLLLCRHNFAVTQRAIRTLQLHAIDLCTLRSYMDGVVHTPIKMRRNGELCEALEWVSSRLGSGATGQMHMKSVVGY